jgi:hypothetical protein
MKRIFVVAAVAVIAACAHKLSEYERLAAMTEPANWAADSIWAFSLIDKQGNLFHSMTVKLTDESVQACAGGDWQRVEVLSQQPASHPQSLAVPAYTLKGRAFWLNFTANVCDESQDLRGELTEAGISGNQCYGSWFDAPVNEYRGECIGSFYAVRILEHPGRAKR